MRTRRFLAAAPFTGLTVLAVSGGYARRQATLQAVTVHFAPGSFTAIVGPNGAGKSTLVKMLVRELRPQRGLVALNDRALSEWSPRARGQMIAYVPQGLSATLGVTVRALLAEARYPHVGALRPYTAHDWAKVTAAAKACQVEPLLSRYVEDLSGGQRQKALLAAAVAQETAVLIVDEPTTYLDIKAQHEALQILHRLHTAGQTIVAVVHDLNHALKYATNVVVMQAGQIVAQGAPRSVLTRPLIARVFGVAPHFRRVAGQPYIADVTIASGLDAP